MMEADRNPSKWTPALNRDRAPENVVPHTQVRIPFPIDPELADIHLHNRKYKLTGVPFLRSSPFKINGQVYTDTSVVRSIPNTMRGCRYAPY